MKITRTKKRTLKPMPPFKTLEEEAKFWDSTSATEVIGKDTVVGFYKANKTKILNIRVEDKDLQKLRIKANKMGIGPTTLARMWLKERLSAT